jgi:hypothetical protein
MTHDHRFYVYAFLRKDGTPYYIGKGQGRRIDSRAGRSSRLPPKDQRRVLIGGLTEAESFEYEIALISLLGRKDQGTGCLRNLTDGGDGTCGAVRSPETRARMSAASRNRSPEHRAKINAANKGRTISPEHRAKINAALRNPSAETRAKMSAAASNRSPETRAKIGAANKARKHSPETLAKIGAATAAREAAKRALREALSGQLALLPQEVTA